MPNGRLRCAAVAALLPLLVIACSSRPAGIGDEAVSTADVHHFTEAFGRWTPADSSCSALAPYWHAATTGLQHYARKFDVSGSDLCRQVRRHPERYERVAWELSALDSAAATIRRVYDQLGALHPLSNRPAVYFVVGDGISAGSTTRGRHPIILIGTELIDSVRHLPGLVAHELVHTQQDYPFWGSMNGGPTFLRGTLLRHSITEGSANFIASLVTGHADSNQWAEAHEAELWREFQHDAHDREYSRWLYNGWNRKALGARPPDLGYWVGYRITQSYYNRATDKQQAIADILTIRDFNAFLRASGYQGGAAAENSTIR